MKNLNIQSGTIVENYLKTKDWELSKEPEQINISRTYRKKIEFDREFKEIPEVIVSICSIDSSNVSNLRVIVIPEEITTKGFTIVFKTWYDAIINQVGVTWISYGR